MSTIKDLQLKQLQLDSFILEKRGLTEEILPNSELLKNLLLALYDEIMEIEEDISNAEEWVDALHFTLAIANWYDFELKKGFIPIESNLISNLSYVKKMYGNIVRRSRCFKHWSDKNASEADERFIACCLSDIICAIEKSLVVLGEDMRKVYDRKYEINVKRQMEGY